MALFDPTFLLGVAVLLYLLSFVLFAVIRIVTGLSIQRIGYFSLRRIVYVPRDGLKIEVRSLGLNIHRPTFLQPTWLSIVVNELVVSVGAGEDEDADGEEPADAKDADSDAKTAGDDAAAAAKARRDADGEERSKAWLQLNKLKDRIKRLHRNIPWLRMVDVVATNSAVSVLGVGNVQVGSFTIAVDTRRKTVDRDRFLFQEARHAAAASLHETRQAEWIIALRSVLLTPDGCESTELIDNATLNIHGFLYDALDGLRDASIAFKVGRLHIPYDDLQLCAARHRRRKTPHATSESSLEKEPSLRVPKLAVQPDDAAAEATDAAAAAAADAADAAEEDALMQTVSDSKEFVSSILRGIKEVQFAVSFLGIAKKVQPIKATGAPVLLMNVSMKEIGIDLHRLDPKSPAHRMYFSPTDIAHEALAAALSIAVGLDDGPGRPQRVVYIPMATTTVKTTLPSKTVMITKDISAEERNANILFANSVITSPSVDLDPRHLPLLLAILRRPSSSATHAPAQPSKHTRRHMLISRILPKANIRLSLHEPVVRVPLPPSAPGADPDDFDLLISSISSISLDSESFHSAMENMHYSLACTMRLLNHDLYYQTAAGTRFDLLQTESFDLKAQLSASPDVHVVSSANLQTFSVQMVRPEIIDGLHQIVNQLRPSVKPDKKAGATRSPVRTKHNNFLRAMPPWLLHFQMQASDFSMQVAGVDAEINDDCKGVAVQLETWTVEYRAQRRDATQRRTGRRRAVSRTTLLPDTDLLASVAVPPPARKHHHEGDGRRIAFHGRGLETFIVESSEKWEVDPFVNVPRFEVAFSTLSDGQGPVFHIHAHVRTLLIHYSLHRHYSVGVATMVLRRAFMRSGTGMFGRRRSGSGSSGHSDDDAAAATAPSVDAMVPDSGPSLLSATYQVGGQGGTGTGPPVELVAVDVKVTLLQVKADMPSDPPLMIQLHELETGRHRWSSPFLQWKLIRMHAGAPRMPHVWARILSIKNGRLDSRETRNRLANGTTSDVSRAFDISTDVVRFAVPHEMVLYKTFDNIINVFKATLQLHHRFKTGTDEYILGKAPEGPKHVPRVSLRCRTFVFELEDGAFEWKLGMIYRAGRVEQMQRLAREEAFRVKVKKIQEEEARRGASTYRARSAAPRGRTPQAKPGSSAGQRAQSEDRRFSDRTSHGRGAHGVGRTPRYDPENSTLGMTGSAHISISEARHKLDLHNARGWKQRIDRYCLMAHNGMKEIRSMYWGAPTPADDADERENILGVPDRPALATVLVDDLQLVIDKPSFPLKNLPDFLHKVGKGMPRDMLYSLLVPMNLQVRMGEAKVTLRDYPLPLLHVPAIAPNQLAASGKLHALALSSDFVIAEEFQGPESVRHIKVDVLPPKSTAPGASKAGSFSIDVRRTTSQVKTYADMTVDINTSLPTRITWGPSYQPAIQDMMMVMESFTKPQLDPSESVGFWDKIRLSFHARVRVAWTADGNVHLALKGTRDPYQVTGNGAGFLMCWRNDVRWNVHTDDDPKRFMTVDSGEYVLAIPDYSYHAREVARQSTDNDSVSSDDSLKSGAAFKKVVMKLSGKVQWMAGLVFERAIQDGQRSFAFAPHYSIVLKDPQYARAGPDGQPYDAFRGFRSQHIHMSIAVRAPVDREWSVSNSEPSRSYNTVHLSPRFFTHFFAWWSLFSGPMSLPIRQGRLWPGCEKNSKKFGRHLATIKYNLLLAPLFLSHIYKHRDADGEAEDGAVSATGIKVRFDSFMLDMHQRREEFNTRDKGHKTNSRTTGMRIHACQLDLASADIRAVSASIKATTVESIQHTMQHGGHGDDEDTADISRFTIPDDDFSWIDMDDFVELDWILPTEPNPDTKILPLAYAPRITYFRQTDIGGVISGDPDRTSPFGHEPTHLCIMSPDDDPRRVQMHLVQDRLDQLETQIDTHVRDMDELVQQRGGVVGAPRDAKDAQLVAEIETLARQANLLQEKKYFLSTFLRQLDEEAAAASKTRRGATTAAAAEGATASEAGTTDFSGAEFASEFTNRFVVHNMKFKWNNMLRNIILRYSHQVSQRRGFIYYLSRPAVKFLLDIVEEQQVKLKAGSTPTTGASAAGPGAAPSSVPGSADVGGDGASFPQTPSSSEPAANGGGGGSSADRASNKDIEDRIRKILQDGKKFVSSDDVPGGSNDGGGSGKTEWSIYNTPMDNLTSAIAAEFTPQNNYHVRLIAPQIQLQSDKNKKHVVLVTAKGMELKVVDVMDKARLSDTVSGLVQRRFLVGMDSTQFFVTHHKWFSTRVLSLYSGTSYGSPRGSSWPPWVPMEAMFDFETDPFGFKRVVQKTSAMLRYDKYNTLRLKYTEGVNVVGHGGGGGGGGDGTDGTDAQTAAAAAGGADGLENRVDNLWVDFPQARALCNSSQYYAIYVIVLDLLMYSEPLEKTRSERLEKIMLASDFSDLRGAPEKVIRLQERVRQLEDIKTHFQIHSKYLDKRGWEERLLLERDLAASADELFFIMKAITTSQSRNDASQSNALLKWSISAGEIVWHLLRDSNQPLVELQLKDVEYGRTDNADGSHINLIQVGKILGLNLLPDAIYPEMIAPYVDARGPVLHPGTQPMVRVYWYMLEAIAGITVMDHFEVSLFPMKIQLEHDVGKKIFEYIFPDSDGGVGGHHAAGTQQGGGGGGEPEVGHNDDNSDDYSDDDDDDDCGDDCHDLAFRIRPGAGAGTFDTRAGSLELRLQPTLTSNPRTATGLAEKQKTLFGAHSADGHSFRFFRSSTQSSGRSVGGRLAKKPSHDSLQSGALRLGGVVRSGTGFTSVASTASTGESKKSSRFVLRSSKTTSALAAATGTTAGAGAADDKTGIAGGSGGHGGPASDDLTKMIARASNYMTFTYIRIPSVVLCLSYKGKGERNLEDVHDFVFRLPTIEYRNKTWSNLDLALALKSRVIKALISHTGAIIGNKLSRHRPNTAQQSKLRELATSSVLLSTPTLLDASQSSVAATRRGRGSVAVGNIGNGGGAGVGAGPGAGAGAGGGDGSSLYNSGDDASSIFGSTSPIDFSRSPPRSLRDSQSSLMSRSRPRRSRSRQRSVSRSSSVASSSRSYRSSNLALHTASAADLDSTPASTSAISAAAAAKAGTAGTAGTANTADAASSAQTPRSVPKFSVMTPPTPVQEAASGRDVFQSGRPASRSGSTLGSHLRPGSRGSMSSEKKRAFGGVRNRLSALATRVKEHGNSGGGGSVAGDMTPVARRHTARAVGGGVAGARNGAPDAAGSDSDAGAESDSDSNDGGGTDDDDADADTDVPRPTSRGLRTQTT